MTLSRLLQWITGVLLLPLALAALFIAIYGWNWLRGPLERMATEQTGRVLAINGDLTLQFDWLVPRLRAAAVTFANPGWTREKQMVVADVVDIAIDLPQLLRFNIVLPEVRLEHPVVFLEQGSGGRKNWLLDINQQDEGARIRIDRLMLDHGMLGYDDAGQQTSIRAELSTASASAAGAGVSFTAQGQYQSLGLKASGNGGPVLGLRDETTPYPLKAELLVGRTSIKVDGTVTSLLKISALDMRLALRGESLAQLFPLLGIAFPETRAYATDGHLWHSAGTWRYEKFAGRVGTSDIAGTLQVDSGGKRPAMKAELVSKLLDVADLGPVIGAQPSGKPAARPASQAASRSTQPISTRARVLPDQPFKTERWGSVDAEVTLKASTFRHARELPLEDLAMHLSLQDSVLTLDPLNFGVAGGHLKAVVSLDGRQAPIRAHAQVRVEKVLLARLLPAVELNKNSRGQVNGEFDLSGKGDSVARMLASANGRLGLVVSGGEISKLMMEKLGMHLWEILVLKVTGDRLVKLRCGIADFAIKEGTMHANALIFDTQVTTLVGTGSINLGQEKLDLVFNQKTKITSPLALRSPMSIRGSFSAPEIGVDRGRIAVRALGAVALGLLNPLIALVPLIDAGPGQDSDCGQLIRASKDLVHH